VRRAILPVHILLLSGLTLLLWQHAQSDALLLWQALALALLIFLGTIPRLLVGPRARGFTRLIWNMVALVVLSVPVSFFAASWQNGRTKQHAALLIRQLEAYRRQQGTYPDSLPQLVPQYLPDVPTTAYGLWRPAGFHYARTATPPAYELAFHPRWSIEWRYFSTDSQWHVRDEND
jgi:type II secretory pathway pseudopilin PulG